MIIVGEGDAGLVETVLAPTEIRLRHRDPDDEGRGAGNGRVFGAGRGQRIGSGFAS